MSKFWGSHVQHGDYSESITVLCAWNLWIEYILNVLTTPQKYRLYEVMDMLISLIVVIISQCTHISKHHGVYLKYLQFLFVHHNSIKLGKKDGAFWVGRKGIFGEVLPVFNGMETGLWRVYWGMERAWLPWRMCACPLWEVNGTSEVRLR